MSNFFLCVFISLISFLIMSLYFTILYVCMYVHIYIYIPPRRVQMMKYVYYYIHKCRVGHLSSHWELKLDDYFKLMIYVPMVLTAPAFLLPLFTLHFLYFSVLHIPFYLSVWHLSVLAYPFVLAYPYQR